MKLQYLGHACFRIISEIGTTVVCDPFDDETLSVPMTHVRADVVTVSHDHHDHNCVQNVSGQPAVLQQLKIDCAADDISISSIQTFHDHHQGMRRGQNFVFTFVVDGLSVAHLGDLGVVDENVIQKVKGCHVLMVPVGGVFTLNAAEAKQLVDAVNPKVVIPMHYYTPEHTFRLGDLSAFTSLFDEKQVKVYGDTVNFWDEPQNEKPEVWIMSRFEDQNY